MSPRSGTEGVALTGEELVGVDRPCCEARLAERIISLLIQGNSARVSHYTR
ncbi:MAG: hypothetical protein ABI986_08395 [Chloroflexota bacterium]